MFLNVKVTYAINDCLFDHKYSKNRNIVKYYYNLKLLLSIWMHLKNVIYSCDCKAEMSALQLLPDPSEIILICWFDDQETFIIVNVEK